MAHLQYYAVENARHFDCCTNAKCSEAEATIAIRKLVSHFLGRAAQVELRFTSGARTSHASKHQIVLNRDSLTWLLVAHEFAHTWDARRRAAKVGELQRQRAPVSNPEELDAFNAKIAKVSKVRWHGKRHAKLVDRCCDYIRAQGWNGQGTLKAAIEAKQEAHTVRERRAAMPPPIEARIAKRQEQIKRLERKIKGLNTRLKRARRSLGALERSAAKVGVL